MYAFHFGRGNTKAKGDKRMQVSLIQPNAVLLR